MAKDLRLRCERTVGLCKARNSSEVLVFETLVTHRLHACGSAQSIVRFRVYIDGDNRSAHSTFYHAPFETAYEVVMDPEEFVREHIMPELQTEPE